MISLQMKDNLQSYPFKNRAVSIIRYFNSLLKASQPAHIHDITFTNQSNRIIACLLHLLKVILDPLASISIKIELLLNEIHCQVGTHGYPLRRDDIA